MAGTITHSWNGTILTITSDSGTTAMDLKGEKGDTGARGVRGLPGKAGGGARIEDGVISDETTWSSSGIVDRFAELMGTNANPAVLDNPYPNYPLQITTTFEPKQEGSGNPYPAGGGKNLLPDINISSGGFTSSGNGVFKCATSGNTNITISTFLFKAGITYTISATTVSGTGYKPCIIVRNPTGSITGQKTNYGETGNPLTFSFDADTNWNIILQTDTGNGLTTVNDSWAIQLEVGSAATEYAPYDNIRPISGWTGAELTRCGKNLLGGFAGKTQNGLTFTINADGSVSVNGTSTAQTELSAPIYLPAGNYYLSGCPAGGTGSNVSGGYAQYCYINGSAYKFDTGSGIHLNIAYAQKIYVNIVIRADTTINKTFYPQIETGYVKTEYEPYRGDTYSADFGQTVYGGTLDWNTGVMTVDKAFVEYDGSADENWLTQTTATDGYRRFRIVPGNAEPNTDSANVAYAVSNMYKAVSPNGTYSKTTGVCVNQNELMIYDASRATLTLDEWKAWLSEHPVQIAYKLATPQTIQLTPQEIKAIKGINTLYSNAQELTVIGRVDTMYQLSKLAERVAALEAR